jgi:type IV pilus assembly protein PilV
MLRKMCNAGVDRAAGGFSLIEVLITILIVGIALMGLAGLQARAITAEAESYSRGQALMLLNDMGQRLEANLPEARTDLIDDELALDDLSCSVNCAGATSALAGVQIKTDICQWITALGTSSGLPSACGCVEGVLASSEVLISVAWRGRDLGYTPTAAQSCGATEITSGRRVVSMRLRVPNLGG